MLLVLAGDFLFFPCLIHVYNELKWHIIKESPQGGVFALLKQLQSNKGEQSATSGDIQDGGGESPETTASSDATGEGLDEDSSQDVHHFEQGGKLL